MKKGKAFEEFLAELFGYDEDMVVLHFDDEELFQEFLEETAK